MKTLIQKPIAHINSEELLNEMRVDILGVNYDDEPYNEIYEGITKQINDPIKIVVLRKLLDQLEEKGANYVAIHFHTDHQELELDGVFVGLATQEEIDDHNNTDKNYQIQFCKERLKVLEQQTNLFKTKLKELSGEE